MKFAAIIEYTPDKSKIAEFRPPHREYLMGLRKDGKAAMAGPFTDDSGGLLIYEAESQEQVEEMIKADPFGQGGVFVSWTIRPWNLLWVNFDLMPALAYAL
jgi:uncharacterized protein